MPKTSDVQKAIRMFADNAPAPFREDAKTKLNALAAVLEAADASEEGITGDADLSSTGRLKRLDDNVSLALAKVDQFETAHAAVLRDRARQTEQKLLASALPKPPDDVGARIAHELDKQAIRTALDPLSHAERTNIVRNSDDVRVIDAGLTAPPSLSPAAPGAVRRLVPFIDPKDRQDLLLARAKVVDPQTAREYADLSALAKTYDTALAHARTALESKRPAPGPQPPTPTRERLVDPSTGKPMPAVKA